MRREVLGTKLLTTEVTESQTSSGIHIPDTVATKTIWKVHHVGVDTTKIRPNDIIYVPQSVGQREIQINYNGQTFNVIDENAVVLYERS